MENIKFEGGKDLDTIKVGEKTYNLYTPLDGSPTVYAQGVKEPLIEVEIIGSPEKGYEVKSYKVNQDYKEIADAMTEIANNNLVYITQKYLESLNKK